MVVRCSSTTCTSSGHPSHSARTRPSKHPRRRTLARREVPWPPFGVWPGRGPANAGHRCSLHVEALWPRSSVPPVGKGVRGGPPNSAPPAGVEGDREQEQSVGPSRGPVTWNIHNWHSRPRRGCRPLPLALSDRRTPTGPRRSAGTCSIAPPSSSVTTAEFDRRSVLPLQRDRQWLRVEALALHSFVICMSAAPLRRNGRARDRESRWFAATGSLSSPYAQ